MPNPHIYAIIVIFFQDRPLKPGLLLYMKRGRKQREKEGTIIIIKIRAIRHNANKTSGNTSPDLFEILPLNYQPDSSEILN